MKRYLGLSAAVVLCLWGSGCGSSSSSSGDGVGHSANLGAASSEVLEEWNCRGSLFNPTGNDPSNTGEVNISITSSNQNKDIPVYENSTHIINFSSNQGQVALSTTQKYSKEQRAYALAGAGAKSIHQNVIRNDVVAWAICDKKINQVSSSIQKAKAKPVIVSKAFRCRGTLIADGGKDNALGNAHFYNVYLTSVDWDKEVVLLRNSATKIILHSHRGQISLKAIEDKSKCLSEAGSVVALQEACIENKQIGYSSTNIEVSSLHFNAVVRDTVAFEFCEEKK